jgi:hypothetical protein
MTSDKLLVIAGMFFIPLIAVLGPIMIGQRYGLYRKSKSKEDQPGSVGAVVGAAMGLLAFMLAITFQIAANRYDARKQLLLKEVTDIRTTFLRAGLVPEPYRFNSRKLLGEYVDLRIDVAKEPSKLTAALNRSQQILDSLWKYAEILAEQDRSSEAYSLFTGSVNDIIDAHNQRVSLAIEYRMPNAVLAVLSIITFFTMLVLGYQFGISGKGNFRISLLLSFIFAIVMFLILALDRPETGLAPINQKPMFTLQKQLHEKL